MDWTIRLGDVLVFVGLLATLFLFVTRIGGYVYSNEVMMKDITELKSAIRDITRVLTEVAVQKTRLDAQAERQNLLERRLEDLRHGRGFIVERNHPAER